MPANMMADATPTSYWSPPQKDTFDKEWSKDRAFSDMSTEMGTTYMTDMSTIKEDEVITESTTLGTIGSYITAPFKPSQDFDTDPMMGTRINGNTIVVPDVSDTESVLYDVAATIGALFKPNPDFFPEDPMLGTVIDGKKNVVTDTSDTENAIWSVVSAPFQPTPVDFSADPMMSTKINDGATKIVPDTSEAEERIYYVVSMVASALSAPFVPNTDMSIDPMLGTQISARHEIVA